MKSVEFGHLLWDDAVSVSGQLDPLHTLHIRTNLILYTGEEFCSKWGILYWTWKSDTYSQDLEHKITVLLKDWRLYTERTTEHWTSGAKMDM